MINRKSTGADPKKQLNKAIHLLSLRPRSVAELVQRGLDKAVPKLIELDLIDDRKFAVWWVEQRVRLNPRGNIGLKAELQQKGIDREIIASVLLSKDEELALAKKLLAKKNLDRPRAQRFLLSRGFPSELVFQLTAV